MTAVSDDERFRQPTIKRLGLDDGWWFFCPHFLNLGLPLVFVDACLISDAAQVGLEPFGTRRHDSPLPSAALSIGLRGDGVSIYSADRQPGFVTGHWFRNLKLPQTTRASSTGIIVGDSYALQLTWSALWSCRIGAAASVQTE